MSNLNAAIKALQNKACEELQEAQEQHTATAFTPGPWDKKEALRKILKEAIITERKSQKISQKRLAQKAGYSQCTVARAEKGLWISINALICLVDALGKKLTLT